MSLNRNTVGLSSTPAWKYSLLRSGKCRTRNIDGGSDGCDGDGDGDDGDDDDDGGGDGDGDGDDGGDGGGDGDNDELRKTGQKERAEEGVE